LPDQATQSSTSFHLFGDMDVDRPVRRHGCDGIELVRRCGAQAVRRDTDDGLLQ